MKKPTRFIVLAISCFLFLGACQSGTNSSSGLSNKNLANGIYDIPTASNQEKIAAYGALEKYVINHHMRSPMFDDYTSNYLEYNSCSNEEWEYFFGENGTVIQTKKEDYWVNKPIMQNADFLTGLDYCIDRQTLAARHERTYPKDNLFYSGEFFLFKSSLNYNSSQTHLNNIAPLLEGTDGYGFSLEKAQACFKKAAESLIKAGLYKNGDLIELEAVVSENMREDLELVTNNAIQAFNNCGGGLKISFNYYCPEVYSDIYYKKMMVGQFDIGLGALSGSEYCEGLYFELLKSDTSYGFTLSWSHRTDVIDYTLKYHNVYWSYNALCKALKEKIYVKNGQVQYLKLNITATLTQKEDGYLVSATIAPTYYDEQFNCSFYGANFLCHDQKFENSYQTETVLASEKDGRYEFFLPKTEFDKMLELPTANLGLIVLCVFYRTDHKFGETKTVSEDYYVTIYESEPIE